MHPDTLSKITRQLNMGGQGQTVKCWVVCLTCHSLFIVLRIYAYVAYALKSPEERFFYAFLKGWFWRKDLNEQDGEVKQLILALDGVTQWVGWASARKAKGHQFGFQSGHMPGLQAGSPTGDVWEAVMDVHLAHECFFPSLCPSLCPSLPLSLKINNFFKTSFYSSDS